MFQEKTYIVLKEGDTFKPEKNYASHQSFNSLYNAEAGAERFAEGNGVRTIVVEQHNFFSPLFTIKLNGEDHKVSATMLKKLKKQIEEIESN